MIAFIVLSPVAISASEWTQASECRNPNINKQTIGDIAFCLQDGLNHVPDVMAMIAYVCGIGLGIKSILKFKEANDSKGQTKLTVPILLAVASSLLLALPAFLGLGAESLGLNKPDALPSNVVKY